MNIGYFQFKPEYHKPKINREFVFDYLRGIKSDIIVLPELAFSGYLFESWKELYACSEDTKGESIKLMIELAKITDTAYVFGFLERKGNIYYNSAACVDKTGILSLYRKIHIFNTEKNWFSVGDLGFPVFTYKKKTIGMLICFDHLFPEAARTLALKGADLVCHPSNLIIPEYGQLTSRVRAMENRIFWILSNRVGEEFTPQQTCSFTGSSQIISPSSQILFSSNENETALHVEDCNLDEAENKKITEKNDLFLDRKPEFYL